MNRTVIRHTSLCLLIASARLVNGQGQNQFQASGIGDQYLINAPPLFPFAPRSVNIGDGSTFNLATLNVRGDQMQVSDDFSPPCPDPDCVLATFRTDVQTGNNQCWSMVRGTPEIGRLWNTAIGNAFNIGSRMDDGAMWIRNSVTDGMRLAYNAEFLMNSHPLHVVGYAQLGLHTAIDQLNPISRLTLVEAQGAGDITLQ